MPRNLTASENKCVGGAYLQATGRLNSQTTPRMATRAYVTPERTADTQTTVCTTAARPAGPKYILETNQKNTKLWPGISIAREINIQDRDFLVISIIPHYCCSELALHPPLHGRC